jgi:hypothetical protein
MYTYKTLIRDKLVDNSTIKSLFGAAATGSCRVNMAYLNVSATYPQIIMEYVGGESRLALDADESLLDLTIEAKGSGASNLHAHKEIGKFRSAILAVIDDTSLQSNTAVAYSIRKIGETELYDENKRLHGFRMSFLCNFNQNTSFP